MKKVDEHAIAVAAVKYHSYFRDGRRRGDTGYVTTLARAARIELLELIDAMEHDQRYALSREAFVGHTSGASAPALFRGDALLVKP